MDKTLYNDLCQLEDNIQTLAKKAKDARVFASGIKDKSEVLKHLIYLQKERLQELKDNNTMKTKQSTINQLEKLGFEQMDDNILRNGDIDIKVTEHDDVISNPEYKLYYTPPKDEIFKEVRDKAMQTWEMISDYPDYLESKQSRIRDMDNVSDNLMTIVAMFDINNQSNLALILSDEARDAIKQRMIAVGTPERCIIF